MTSPASDIRLILNEVIFKRAAHRLQQQWPTALTLTQAKHTLAKTLGFDDYDHLKRALPAAATVVNHQAHTCAQVLDTLAAQLMPWVTKEGGILIQWSNDDAPQTNLRGALTTMALPHRASELLAALDTYAGGTWDRSTPLTLPHPQLRLTFSFLPAVFATPDRLCLAAVPASVTTSPLAVVGDDTGLLSLFRTHHTGVMLCIGGAGSGKSFSMHASALDWQQRGQTTAFLDPAFTEPADGLVGAVRSRSLSDLPDNTPLRVTFGDVSMLNRPRILAGHTFSSRSAIKAIQVPLQETWWARGDGLSSWVRPCGCAVEELRMHHPSEAQECRVAFQALHGVVFHGSHAWQDQGAGVCGYLTRHDLDLLAQVSMKEWGTQLPRLIRYVGTPPRFF